MNPKLFFTIFITLIGFNQSIKAQNVNIPDANFKNYLVSNPSINTNGDGEIQTSEASAYTGAINATGLNISDLTGIQSFTALTGLDCSYNNLTSIDVSSNTSLTSFYCNNNQLTSLNVSANTALISFDCSVNQLTGLNIATNTTLTTLGCNNNQLTSLNLTANTALSILTCGSNQITNLNLALNTVLTSIDCGHNQLTALNVSSNTSLVTLSCYNNQITSLNVSAISGLKYLNCQVNQLTSLDVSLNTALKDLGCYDNQLTALNAKNGNNTNFSAFYAYNNPLLTCIQVDNPTFMNTNWPSGKDASANYSLNCSGAGVNTLNYDNEITIYPNPANGSFKVASNTTDKLVVDLYDFNGRHVFSKTIVTTTDIDVNSLDNGIYTLTIKTISGATNKKLAITH